MTKEELQATFIDANGKEQNYAAAVLMMSDELREEVHRDMAPCMPQEFIEEYAKRHKAKFSSAFPPYAGGAW